MVIKSERTLSPLPGTTQEKTALRQALPQILAVCVKNVLLLGFGMTLGFPTILIPSLSGSNPDERIQLGQEAISWIGSINLICVPIGCLLSGAITQPIGRKRAMQLVNIPFLTAWLLFHFANESWQVFLALCITGLSGGLLEAPVLTYVAEITQPHLRGMLSSTSTMSVILGVLFQFLLGTFLSWRQVVLVNCCAPVISFISLMFVPETPVWLILKNRFNDARHSIAWLRGWVSLDEVEEEFQELCKQLGKTQPVGGVDNAAFENNYSGRINREKQPIIQKPSRIEHLKLFTKKGFLWPYFIVGFTFFLGHFNGSTPVQTFAINLFTTLKAPINKYYATVLLGTVQLLGCITCVSLVNLLGKRILNFISLLASGVCFITVATYAYVTDVNYLQQGNSTTSSTTIELDNYHWIPVTFLVLAAFFSYLGIKILPWILTGEVFATEIRATASGLSGGIGYIFGFISNKIFLSLISNFTLPGTFWFYGAVSFVGTIVLYFVLPETEGKTLYDITEHFAGRSRISNKVTRRHGRGQENAGFDLEEPHRDAESRL